MKDRISPPQLLSETEREQVITQHLLQANFLASKLGANAPQFIRAEFVGVAQLALVTAATLFDKNVGTQFKTYAERKIRGAILDFMRKQDYMTRNDRKDLKAIFKEQNRSVTPSSISEAIENLGADTSRTVRLKETARGILEGRHGVWSLDDLLLERASRVIATTTSPEAGAMKRHDLRAMRAALKTMPEREQYILRKRFCTDKKVSQATVGRELGLDSSRISQLQTDSISKLREIVLPKPAPPTAPKQPTRTLAATAG